MQHRPRFPRIYVLCIAALAGAAAAWTARAEAPERDALPPVEIRDLDYGDVLFHYFQDDYFDSLVRLEANRDFGRLAHHAGEAELLSGGLYLSLGMQAEAERIFDRLLAGPVAPGVRDRARFYLARIAYQRGYPDVALRNLQQVAAPLPGKLEPERQLLQANVLMALGRYADAAAALEKWNDTSGWANYARYNLGVALVRGGQPERGRPYLEQVGTLSATNEEQAALRDRANLALGYSLLQQQGAADPAVALSRVRLDGPYTNQALLALGWAESNASHPERALVPWLELQKRPLLDAPVQEARIAVPYAYAQLASNGQASQQYRAAIDAYAAESRRLAESIAAIRAGGFLDAVLAAAPTGDQPGWFWQLEKVPDAPHTRYLYHLMASHAFQEGLKNYRDLRLMQANLARWSDSLEAFDAMIEARTLAAASREPRRAEMLASVDLDGLEARQHELQERVRQAADARDVAAFATPAQREQLAAIDTVERRIAALPAGPQRDDYLERARLLRGTLLWELDRDYRQRLVRTQRDLRQSQAQLLEAAGRRDEILATSIDVPATTSAFVARIDALSERVATLAPLVERTALAQERALGAVAIAELEAQQRRLGDYSTQAQFALAALYDGASSGGGR